MRTTKTALSLAALALGTALAAAPALAQNYPVGRSANDGGQVNAQPQTGGQRTGSASNTQAGNAGGDIYAFGGQGQPPGVGYHYPVGRAANDGGFVTAQSGTQRTGAADNERTTRGMRGHYATRSGRSLYNSMEKSNKAD